MTPSGNGHRILVVDDEQSIVDAVATALRYEGYQVEEAATGHEALGAVARYEPDLVVLDWMLPTSRESRSAAGFAPRDSRPPSFS